MKNGRIKIICDLKPTGDIEQDKVIIPKIISLTLPFHQENVADITRLFNYYYNKTDVLMKEKTQQPNINNKIGIDYALIALNEINGYSFANALTFSSRDTDNREAMKAFNDSLDDDNYSQKLKKVVLNYGICGLAYKYIVPANDEDKANDIWYKTITDIDPRTTYCVYDNTLEHNKICAVSYRIRKKYDEKLHTSKSETVYTVWTNYHQWEFIAKGELTKPFTNTPFVDKNGNILQAYPLPYGKIPIVEYRSIDGTGYFELAIDLINAINVLASSRVDDVQQSVDYIITLRDIDTSDGELAKIKACISEGLLSFRSVPNATVQPEIDVLDTKINQSEVQTLQEFLNNKLEEVLCIPNRNNKSSGGDTGSAVESRNGFRSLENKASIITDDIIAGENDALKVIFAMCKNISSCPFSGMKSKDIEIKDNRNKYENLSTASTAYSTLKSAGMNDMTALEVTRLVPDAITVSELNKREQQETTDISLQNEIKRTQELSKLYEDNEDNDEKDADNGKNENASKKTSDDKGSNTNK